MGKKTKKPQIRFAGFTDDWEQRKLSDIVDVLDGDRGKNYPKETDFDTNGHTLFLNASNVTTDGFSFDTNQFISEEKSDSMGNGKLIDDDIVITSRGSLGHIAWYSADIQRIVPYVRINSGMLILRKKVSINTSYLYQFMKSDKGQNQISFMSFGSAQPQLTKKGIEGLNVNYPKKSKEQAKIGEYFSNLDNLITLHQRKLDKLKSVKKSMLEKMIPQNGEVKPEIRFTGFTDDWEQRKLGDVVDVRSGRDYKHLEEGDIPVYGTGGYMLSINEALSDDEDAIGIGRKGTIDNPYILRAPFWTVDTLFYAVPRDKYDLNFVFDIFQNVNWKAKDESTGIPSLSKATINAVETLMPEYAEQKKIGEYFSNLENLITLHQRKLEKLQNIKKAMLEKMFV
ncbi:restriction endonuclease subunit S [Bariatricus sp. HCP28S3_A7]|uniref:restriction endonuclease subunit S n=1 Tax=Bariatricus sp. HCP28S3_A7 TaxID=3438894 RepID=UPI003F8A64A1